MSPFSLFYIQASYYHGQLLRSSECNVAIPPNIRDTLSVVLYVLRAFASVYSFCLCVSCKQPYFISTVFFSIHKL